MNGTFCGIKRILEILHEHFFWPKMKCNVERVCSRCITYRQAKSRILSYGLYTPLSIPTEPWVDISMDLVLGFSMSRKGRDSIFIVDDRFFKMVHFIPCHKIDYVTKIVDLFFRDVFGLHGILKSIVSNHDVNFLNYIWKTLWAKLRTKLIFSTTYHSQTDG